ncbi:YlbE-like protein [Oceanobacillus limi]|uniref:YlbE-like protein n=1 Tax=Oceanobacillus limi TaxID=930131 RepID=A0A1I0DD09_9BACI|nr:YlbE-like family protein [Oceanobacillus limi]SET29888.1 YlbE-like protein [Oceanobacillus limi]
MNSSCYNYLKSRPELLQFVRSNPMWYRYLTRDPNRIYEIEKEAKRFYGKTFPQQVEKINNGVQMVGMFLQFAETMKD